MTDKLTPARRSVNMSKIRSRDTKPELVVRQLIHSMGYRYRLHRKELPGKPDLVFGPRKKAIFVHGCFWHQHSKTECLDGRLPKSNTDYWHEKLRKNIERDALNRKKLTELGWKTLVVWECETKNSETLARKLKRFIEQ